MGEVTWSVQLASALQYLIPAVLVLCFGTGILLYERFAAGSRRLFVVAAVIAAWFMALLAMALSPERAIAEFWWAVALGFQALTASAVYWLAVGLTGSGRQRLARAAWLAGWGWFGLTVLRPDLQGGVALILAGEYKTTQAMLGMVFVSFVSVLVAGAILEFLGAYRRALTVTDRHRHRATLIAMGVSALSLVDYLVDDLLPGGVGVSSVAIPAAVAMLGVAQVRYRTFAADAGFAAEDALRTLSDAVLVCDDAGTVRIANPGALRLIGGGRAVVVGRPVADFLVAREGGPGQDGPTTAAGGALLGEDLRDVEMRLRPLEGEPIPVAVSAERLRGKGAPAGSVIVARDLRERLASQRALAASDRRYRSLFWHNPGLAYEFDTDGAIVHLNPAAERLFGAQPAELVGRPFLELMAPDHVDRAMALFRGVLAGKPQQYRIDVITLAGARKTLRGVSIPILEGEEVTGVFGVALDVTGEARAKRELEVQRRYFAELFEGSPEAIAMVCVKGTVKRVNSEFTRIFGYSGEEAVGQLLDDLIVPEDDREAAATLALQAVDGRLQRAEVVRRRKDGGLVDVSVLAHRIRIPGEEPQVYAIYRDVSDRKRAEEKLKEREEELRHAQRLEAVGKLAGGIAHDFNNLLTVINGHARFVLDEIAPDDRFRADLEEVERAGVRAASLTQQLLAFSRRQVLRPRALDLNGVVRDMERLLRRLIGSHIRLGVDLAEALPTILADRGQVEQVVMNLAVNARDAMPDGGVLGIRTDTMRLLSDDPRAGQWDIAPGPYVCLTVEDTGVGMASEVLARAFDPFFTTKERGKGTGLGLPTVFGIVKQSGGHVVAKSEPGAGSRFSVYLPAESSVVPVPRADAAPAGTDPADACAQPAPKPGGVVLVVEDEAAVRNLAVRVIERRGHTVLSASDGSEAMELAASCGSPIDVLVSDLVMPNMGGRELARRIRSMRPSIRVLLMSGYEDEMVTGHMDADEFLPKPFTPAELADLVDALLTSRAG